jgi:hypothetical protein
MLIVLPDLLFFYELWTVEYFFYLSGLKKYLSNTKEKRSLYNSAPSAIILTAYFSIFSTLAKFYAPCPEYTLSLFTI